MSSGRVELGLGAGWFTEEHDAYGIPFPDLRERFDRLAEQLEIISGLWKTPGDETFTFSGSHYSLTESPALPKPVQSPPPVIVGGGGPVRTPRLAARFAAEFNTPFLQPEDAAAQFQRVREACEAIDRDPASITLSSALIVCCGEDSATIERRAEAIGWKVEDLIAFGACGSPAQVADRINQWRDAGAERAYLQILDMGDLDHVRLIGREVAPLLA